MAESALPPFSPRGTLAMSRSSKRLWPALAILEEKLVNHERHFLIKWAGKDRKGNAWPDSWEPEANCSRGLVAEWDGDGGAHY